MKGKKWAGMCLAGLAMFLEHLLRYGYVDMEVRGHETYGLILILVGLFGFYWENLRIKKPVWDSTPSPS